MAILFGKSTRLSFDLVAGIGNQHRTDGATEDRQVVATVTGEQDFIVPIAQLLLQKLNTCLLYTSPSPRDRS